MIQLLAVVSGPERSTVRALGQLAPDQRAFAGGTSTAAMTASRRSLRAARVLTKPGRSARGVLAVTVAIKRPPCRRRAGHGVPVPARRVPPSGPRWLARGHPP